MIAHRWPALALGALFLLAGHPLAGDLYNKDTVKTEAAPLPKPAEVQTLDCYPSQISLKSIDDGAQLIVTAKLSNERLQDLTSEVKYEVTDPKVARITSSGRVVPLANGSTDVVARFG